MTIGWLTETLEAEGTVDQALASHGMDFEVGLHPINTRIYHDGKETRRRIDDHKAVVRMDSYDPIAVVGKDYTAVQYTEAFGALDTLVDEGRMQIERVRLLRGGARVMIVTSMPEKLVIAGEPITRYQAWFAGHDGKTTISMVSVPTRDFCTNAIPGMLSIAGRDAGSYKIRHTRHALRRLYENQETLFGTPASREQADLDDMNLELEQIREDIEKIERREREGLRLDATRALDAEAKYVMELQQVGNQMARRKLSSFEFNHFLEKLIPIDPKVGGNSATMKQEKRADIRSIYMSSDNLGNVQDTAWGAFMAVCEWNDHYKRYTKIDSKIQSIVAGSKEVKDALALLRN